MSGRPSRLLVLAVSTVLLATSMGGLATAEPGEKGTVISAQERYAQKMK
jgi:hypothetical protein